MAAAGLPGHVGRLVTLRGQSRRILPRIASRAGTASRRASAGPASAGIWPVLWEFWQYRGARLKRLAPTFVKGPHRR